MKYLSDFFCFLLFSHFNQLLAQSPIKITGYSTVEEYFNEQYADPMRKRIYPYTIDTLCQSGCSFLSFVITKSGSISNISFDKNTPLALIDMLRLICHQSNGKWVIDDSVKEDILQILIPVYYNFYESSGKKCKAHKTDYKKGTYSMMSTFQDSKTQPYTKIEKSQAPKNIWLFSPLYFQTIYYFHHNSK